MTLAVKPLRTVNSLVEAWSSLSKVERLQTFQELSRQDAEDIFLSLPTTHQAEIYSSVADSERRSWIRLLAPDDAADLIQELQPELRTESILLLDSPTRTEVYALLAYAEDKAGGLMNSRFLRLRPEASVDEAIRYLRAQINSQVESMTYAYVLEADQKLIGVVSFRQLFTAPPDKRVMNIMKTDLITIPEEMDQEKISILFSKQGLMAIPVIDQNHHMKGIITIDDIIHVVQEEATEDIQKIGGTQVLEGSYLETNIFQMVKKRIGWLAMLFIGELFTATAMGYFSSEIERAVVLALFIPLIISSGGNSGSQASTLIIRAMALGEVQFKNWWQVFFREICSGLLMGSMLALIGLSRILLWPNRTALYGEHYMLVGLAVAASIISVVLWGGLVGSMLPFILRRLGFDPAAASAPLVATLVDVTGLVIYFSLAALILTGTVL